MVPPLPDGGGRKLNRAAGKTGYGSMTSSQLRVSHLDEMVEDLGQISLSSAKQ